MSGQPGMDGNTVSKADFEGLRADVRSLAKTINENIVPQLATIGATTQHIREQHGKELDILFTKTKDQGERLGMIERDYVPRKNHDEDMQENREEHRDFRDALDDQRTFTGRINGAVAVGALVVGAVIAWVVGKL